MRNGFGRKAPYLSEGFFGEAWMSQNPRKGFLKDVWKAPRPRKGCLKKLGKAKGMEGVVERCLEGPISSEGVV